jgi:hypothetical protein
VILGGAGWRASGRRAAETQLREDKEAKAEAFAAARSK